MRALGINHTDPMPLARIYAPLGYLLAYLTAVALGRLATQEASGLALFWPAAGVAALWMLRGTRTRQVLLDVALLFTGTTALFLVLDVGLRASLVLGAANTVQGFAVRYVRGWRRGCL